MSLPSSPPTFYPSRVAAPSAVCYGYQSHTSRRPAPDVGRCLPLPDHSSVQPRQPLPQTTNPLLPGSHIPPTCARCVADHRDRNPAAAVWLYSYPDCKPLPPHGPSKTTLPCSARLGSGSSSARLGPARHSSARLGSTRLGPARGQNRRRAVAAGHQLRR